MLDKPDSCALYAGFTFKFDRCPDRYDQSCVLIVQIRATEINESCKIMLRQGSKQFID